MMYDGLIVQIRQLQHWFKPNGSDQFNPYETLEQAANAVEELRKAVLRLEDESGLYDELPTFYIYPAKWIPVSERLPDVGKKVLVFAYGHDVLTARLRKETENDYHVFECNGIYLEMAKQGRITHWMTLPEPPKDG